MNGNALKLAQYPTRRDRKTERGMLLGGIGSDRPGHPLCVGQAHVLTE